MLKQLYIKNYALIDALSISVPKGLTIITGETGAGKSILLGALGLLEGNRSDVSVLYNKEEKCIIEGVFDLSLYDLQALFEQEDLDYLPKETNIRREISNAGKSRAFINDTPVSLEVLKKIAFHIIDIHSQHDHLLILSPQFQLNFIDRYAGIQAEVSNYYLSFQEYKQESKKHHQLLDQKEKDRLDIDYTQYLLEELEQTNLMSNELEQLEQEIELLEHAEEIKIRLNAALVFLEKDQSGILTQLKALTSELSHLPSKALDIDLVQRIDTSFIELQDIASVIDRINDKTTHDPLTLEQKRVRVDRIYFLLKKHRVLTIEELLTIQHDLRFKLDQIIHIDEHIVHQNKKVQELHKGLEKKAQAISIARKKVFAKIEKSLHLIFQELNMPDAELKIFHTPAQDFLENGLDMISFKIKTNKGSDFKEIQKAASGGELSRIMLAVKFIMAQKMSMPFIIFDEIDTGVSGQTAHKIGSLLESLSTQSQVWVITHLPQVASKGKNHFKVYKETESNKTRTQISLLNSTQRVEEIATLLSSGKVTPVALKNAKELLQSNQNT
jgi:DNA repair protein RecN (Recombination protein N)